MKIPVRLGRVLSEASPVRPRRINAPFIGNGRLRNSPAGSRASASATREPAREADPEEGGNWFAFGRVPATATAPAGPERHWRKRRGPLGRRRPGKPRRDPCPPSLHGSRTRKDPGRKPPNRVAARAPERGAEGAAPLRGRRKPDVVYLGRNPLLALGDIGRRTSDPELRTVTVNSLWGRR